MRKTHNVVGGPFDKGTYSSTKKGRILVTIPCSVIFEWDQVNPIHTCKMQFKTKYDIVFQNMDTLAPYFFIFFFWGGGGQT